MDEILISVLLSLGTTGIVAFLLRHWILERLRHSIKHEYDEKLERTKAALVAETNSALERYKADVAREASILAVAHRSLGESVALAQTRRVEGVAELWKALLHTRNSSPPLFTFLDALLPDEYATLHEHQFKTFPSDVSADDVRAMLGDNAKAIESVRPFLGDYLWYLFYVYQGVHFRIAMLYHDGREKGSITPWFRDKTTLKLFGSVASEEEMQRFADLKFGQIAWMRSLIEGKFLREAEQIISGQASGDLAAQHAARIARAVTEINASKGSNNALEPTLFRATAPHGAAQRER